MNRLLEYIITTHLIGYEGWMFTIISISSMENCIFCKIISGDVSSARVYENDYVIAFLDINPNNHGHTLVIPKEHSKNIFDISHEAFQSLTEAVKKIADAVYRGMEADGINITMNNEKAAGQIVFHTHIHIIPRFESDGLKVWDRKSPYKEGEMEKVAERIKAKL